MARVRQKKEIRAAVLRAAGTNCDYETGYALTLAGARPVLVHVRELLDGIKKLNDYHLLIIPGGFSYGDDLGAGKLLANEVRYLLGEEMTRFVKAGKPVLGICNGFQVLVKAGFLPEFQPGEWSQEMSLVANDSARFECRWTFLKPNPKSPCVFTQGITEPIPVPIAHGEGKVVFRDALIQEQVVNNNLVAFQYVDSEGNAGPYPVNPNGSAWDIAGICDPTGRILGMMPHPERHVHQWQHPWWTRRRHNEARGAGLRIFENAVQLCKDSL